ncbi:MAG: S1C family serine protease, partial [Alphaproteobacteria bacterium]|nr:S1C family serine protease [Alphaproteobacteria bacterium]
MKKYLFAMCILCLPSLFGMGKKDMVSMLNKLNQGVVNIETTIVHSAYKNVGITAGTGFLINKEKGVFLTNSHVVSPGSVCRYTIRFSDGKEAKAKLIYYDPWQDFAFLEVAPTDIPEHTEALKLKPNAVVENEEVFIIGNNGGKQYSFLSGRIANRFESMGYFPNQSFRITLNNAPGSSGSPVLNMSGEVIGIIHSGNDASSAFALPMEYIVDSLKEILAQRTPSRQHFGALVEYASLDKTEKFLKLPSEESVEYIKKYPSAKRRILKVWTVLKGSPAEGLLFPGDVIMSVNGRSVGPNLYELDKQINDSKGALTLEIYRYGEKVSVTVKTYDLQHHKINRLVIAGGAVFYSLDDSLRLQTGAAPESVFVTNVQKGGSFYYA